MSAHTQAIFSSRKQPKEFLQLLDGKPLGVASQFSQIFLGRFHETPQLRPRRNHRRHQHIPPVFHQVSTIGTQIMTLIQ